MPAAEAAGKGVKAPAAEAAGKGVKVPAAEAAGEYRYRLRNRIKESYKGSEICAIM